MPRGVRKVTESAELSPEQAELVKQANADWKAPVEKERMYRLKVQRIGDEKSEDFFVSVNFKEYQIRYGEEVIVPESVIHNLHNTVITTMVQDPHTEKLKPAEKPRFAFSALPV